MKLLGKGLLTLLVIIILALVALYLLLPTEWAAKWASRQVSQHSDYQLSLSRAEYQLTHPGTLQLNHLSFGRKGQPALLAAEQVDLGFGLQQFSQPLHFTRLTLARGTLNAATGDLPAGLQADSLQLRQMALTQPQWLSLQAQRVDATLTPWQPKPGYPLGKKSTFHASAGTLELNGVATSNAVAEGEINGDALTLSALEADIARGSVNAQLSRNAQGEWQINRLRLNGLRLQTDKNLREFLAPLQNTPSLTIGQLEVSDARLEGQNWAVNDLELALRNLTLDQGDWQSSNGTLSLHASNLVDGGVELTEPQAQFDFTPQGADIRQLATRWARGEIHTTGHWQRSERALTLDNLIISGLEYTLPLDWRERWMQPLPAWLNSVKLNTLNADRNLIIDINPDFPFQLTALGGSGQQLELVRNQQWGIWSGDLDLNAAEVTFNRIDLLQPALALSADQQQIVVSKVAARRGAGELSGIMTIGQQIQRPVSLELNGHQVDAALFNHWGWPRPLPEQAADLQLKATASLQGTATLKPSVNATIKVNGNNQRVLQRVVNGKIAAEVQPDQKGDLR